MKTVVLGKSYDDQKAEKKVNTHEAGGDIIKHHKSIRTAKVTPEQPPTKENIDAQT